MTGVQTCALPIYHQRVVRPAAQRLRAREQVQQRRVPRRTSLDGTPCEIMKCFVLAALGGGEGLLAAVAPLRTAVVSW